MPNISVRFNLDILNDRLNSLARAAENLQPFMQEGSDYMVRSTQNRILRQKKSPDGIRWDANSAATIGIKGFNSPLFQSGDIARGIKAQRVTRWGFAIVSTAKSEDGFDYGSAMQKGIKRTKGFIKNKRVPARPFLGFSQENIRVLSRMLKQHLLR